MWNLGLDQINFSSFADISVMINVYQLPAKYSASFEIPEEGTCALEQKLREAERAKRRGNMDHRVIWNSKYLKMLQEKLFFV